MLDNPELGFRLINILSWMLIALGLFKIGIYAVGELAPNAYKRIKSDTWRKLLTGTGNRLLFGVGGFLTALLGAIFLAVGRLLAYFNHTLL